MVDGVDDDNFDHDDDDYDGNDFDVDDDGYHPSYGCVWAFHINGATEWANASPIAFVSCQITDDVFIIDAIANLNKLRILNRGESGANRLASPSHFL